MVSEFRSSASVKEGMTTTSLKKAPTKPSKPLPPWMWFLIAKMLGIRQHPRDSVLIASIIHLCSLASAISMIVTQIWYLGYDIASDQTQADIMDGLITIIIVGLFGALGLYAHRLSFRLFVHPKFLDMMRLHAKTVVRMNAALLIFIILTVFIVVMNYDNSYFMYFHVTLPNNNVSLSVNEMNPCQTVSIPIIICQTYFVSQVIYSIFFLFWNGIVAMALMSVARTHTVAIRRLICQFECDSYLLDNKFRKEFQPHLAEEETKDSLKHYLWLDSDHLGDLMNGLEEDDVTGRDSSHERAEVEDRENIEDDDEPTFFPPGSVQLKLNMDATTTGGGGDVSSSSAAQSDSLSDGLAFTSGVRSRKSNAPEVRPHTSGIAAVTRIFRGFRRLSEHPDQDYSVSTDDKDDVPIEVRVMSVEEILHKYWKVVAATSLTSQAFQRWMCWVTVIVLFWSAIRIVYWLSHTPTLSGILTLIFPLLVLPLLCSAYSEVNYEGVKVLQSILPTPERTSMFRYLYGMPIEMSVYGRPINYGTMGTVFAAILAALTSKILLEELNGVIGTSK